MTSTEPVWEFITREHYSHLFGEWYRQLGVLHAEWELREQAERRREEAERQREEVERQRELMLQVAVRMGKTTIRVARIALGDHSAWFPLIGDATGSLPDEDLT